MNYYPIEKNGSMVVLRNILIICPLRWRRRKIIKNDDDHNQYTKHITQEHWIAHLTHQKHTITHHPHPNRLSSRQSPCRP